ncbi:MAG TPA: IPT/TIG domain-containing protein [Pseudolysinimonas sp.]|nr:IPT/TIG domain-containing protein [Pseudolysinimonas sp.]
MTEYAQVPIITSISPMSGPAGTIVTVNGSGLAGATLAFNGVAAVGVTSTGVRVIGTAPTNALGAADVTATTGLGTATRIGGFTYTSIAAAGPTLPVTGQDGRLLLLALLGVGLISAGVALVAGHGIS